MPTVVARILLVLAALAGLAAPLQAETAQPSCAGNDLLVRLGARDPEAEAAILAAGRDVPNGEAILWRIEGRNGAVSWLFGTVHLTDARVHAIPAAAMAALRSSHTLALEIDDLGSERMAEAMSKAGRHMLITDGRRLDQLLAPTEFARLKAKTASAGMPIEMAARLRPWFLSMLLALPECEHARQTAGLLPLDMALAALARKKGIEVVGLESILEQFGALSSMSSETEIEWLKASLNLADQLDDMTETTVQLYLTRRMGAVWPLTQKLAGAAAMSGKAMAEFQHALLGARNLRMLERALPHLENGRLFIAVGALHLSGHDGLVALLREAGFKVEPVN